MMKKSVTSNNDWITTAEAAEISGYHPVHIRRILLSGKVSGQKWGTQWQISKTSLMRYLQKMKKRGKKRGPRSRTGK
jgi:excisionase family DNA binding protein